MVAGDSSDDEDYSDSENEGTNWTQKPAAVVVGSEVTVNNMGSPTVSNASHVPQSGGPFSALIQSMWPQEILGKIQQVCIYYKRSARD